MSEPGPVISVIVPACRAERWLGECLESIRRQSFARFEVIVAADSQADVATFEVAQKTVRCDSRFRVVDCRTTGPSAGRNAALDEARGQWYVFVDADDLLPVDSLATLLRAVESTGCLVAFGRHLEFVRSSHVSNVSNTSDEGHLTTVSAANMLEKVLYRRKIPAYNSSVWAKIFHKSLWTGLRFVTDIVYEDLEIFPRLMLRAETVAVTDAAVYFYRQTPGSIMHTVSLRRLDALAAARSVREFILADKSASDELRLAADDRLLSAAFNILFMANGHRDVLGCDNADSMMAACLHIIKKQRAAALRNPRSRFRNRLVSLLSMLGLLQALLAVCRLAR